MLSIRYLPLTLFILLLAADQFTRIPAVKEAGRPDSTPMENMTASLRAVLTRYHTEKKEKVIFFFGSSRSEIFSFLKPEIIEQSPQLNPDMKAKLLTLTPEPRFITRAADMLTIYVYVHNLIQSGYRPEYIVLEISPEIFNRNRPVNIASQINMNIIDEDLLHELLFLTEGNERQEVFARSVFHSYSSRIHLDRMVSGLISGREDSTAGFVHALIAGGNSLKDLPENYAQFHRESIPEDIYNERFIKYTEYLKKDIGLADFRTDPAAVRMFSRLMKKLKTAGIKVILFTPAVHDLIHQEWDRSGFHTIQADLLSEAAGNTVYYSDINNDNACPYFIDSSHMAYRCGPYVLYRLLDEAGYF